MKIAILIHTGLDQGCARSAVGIAKAALAKGHEVTVFVMSAGVTLLADEAFTSLVGDGVNLTVCEHNRAEYKAPEGVEGVHYGSQYDLAGYVQECDRLISFT